MVPATTETYTLSLHDALPIFVRGLQEPEVVDLVASRLSLVACLKANDAAGVFPDPQLFGVAVKRSSRAVEGRSEEHTSELQSRQYLVCRLLLEKKKT